MKFQCILSVLFVVFLIGTNAEDSYENQSEDVSDEYDVDYSTRGMIASSQARKALNNAIEQMGCGDPELGIPPLAPYSNEDLTIDIKKSVLSTNSRFERLQIDGLNNIIINTLSVGVFTKKVKYDLLLPEIRVRTKFNSKTDVDLMNKLGIDVSYVGQGNMDFVLKDLSLKGSLKYKMPILWGKAKIYNFNIVVELGTCYSNIQGLFGEGALNQKANESLEKVVISAINDNQEFISAQIEEFIVPKVNKVLDGTKIWSLLPKLGGNSGPIDQCVPSSPHWYD